MLGGAVALAGVGGVLTGGNFASSPTSIRNNIEIGGEGGDTIRYVPNVRAFIYPAPDQITKAKRGDDDDNRRRATDGERRTTDDDDERRTPNDYGGIKKVK